MADPPGDDKKPDRSKAQRNLILILVNLTVIVLGITLIIDALSP